MLRTSLPALALLFGTHVIARPLPVDPDVWFRDPLQWESSPDGVWRARGNASSLSVCEAIPVCKWAEVSATIRASKANPEGWSVAGVALVADPRNFWHVALVAAPEKSGGKRYFELCEMLDGRWLAQNNLRAIVSEEPGVWEPGAPVHLRLKLDPTGIEGIAEKPDGTLLFRRRFEFTAKAVTTGRPALRAGGFNAEFRDLQSVWRNPLPQESVGKSNFPPYTCTSFVPNLTGKATGFFRVEQCDGIWWAFDPHGRGFIPLGIDHVRYDGMYCETLGYSPHKRKNDAKFANREEWAKQTLDRLTSWGFNLISGATSPELLHRGLGHALSLGAGTRMALLGDEFDITPNERRPVECLA